VNAIAAVLPTPPAIPAAQPMIAVTAFEALLNQPPPALRDSAVLKLPVAAQAVAPDLSAPTLPQLPAIDTEVAAVTNGLPIDAGDAAKIARQRPADELPRAVVALSPKASRSAGKSAPEESREHERGEPPFLPTFTAPPVPPATTTTARPDAQAAWAPQIAENQPTSIDIATQPATTALQVQPAIDPAPKPATADLQRMAGVAERPVRFQDFAASRLFTTTAAANASPIAAQPATASPEAIIADIVTTRTLVSDNPAASIQTPIQPAPALSVSPAPSAEAAMHPPQLDLISDMAWIDQLARDISASAAGDGKLRFRLMPEFLGELDVALTHRQDAIDISMQAGSETAARIIAAEQPRMIEDLRQSGLRVGNFETTAGQQNQNPRQQSAQSHQPTSEQFKSHPSPKRNGRFA
jgi:flagellar hook-length control protein FliK